MSIISGGHFKSVVFPQNTYRRTLSLRMGDGMEDISQMTSQQVLCDPMEQKTRKRPSTLKVLKLSANSTSRLIYFVFFSQSGYS